MMEIIGGILLGIGVAMTVWAAVRRRASTHELMDGAQFLPVPGDVQARARQLLDDGLVTEAIVAVSQEKRLELSESRAIVDSLAAGRDQPSSYEESAARLRREHPDLARRVAALAASGSTEEAMRELRDHIRIGLFAARDLVSALGDSTSPPG